VIKNTAFPALLTTFLLVAWFAGEVTFLAPYKAALFRNYGWVIVGGILLLFVNLSALFYALARWLFLRDAGRKLSHLDRQLRQGQTTHEDLAAYFKTSRR
jgi:hypothetical protein